MLTISPRFIQLKHDSTTTRELIFSESKFILGDFSIMARLSENINVFDVYFKEQYIGICDVSYYKKILTVHDGFFESHENKLICITIALQSKERKEVMPWGILGNDRDSIGAVYFSNLKTLSNIMEPVKIECETEYINQYYIKRKVLFEKYKEFQIPEMITEWSSWNILCGRSRNMRFVVPVV